MGICNDPEKKRENNKDKDYNNNLFSIYFYSQLNTLLQCLVNIRPLSEYFFMNSKIIQENPNGKITKIYYDILVRLYNKKNLLTDNLDFYCFSDKIEEIINELKKEFIDFFAMSIKDLTIFIYENLNKELINIEKKNSNNEKNSVYEQSEELQEYENFKKKYYQKNDSIIRKLFCSEKETIFKCRQCNISKYIFTANNIIIFQVKEIFKYAIKNAINKEFGVSTLEYCFKFLQKEKKIKDKNNIFLCHFCNMSCYSSIFEKIYKFPKIMTIALDYDIDYQYSEKFTFPLILNLENNYSDCSKGKVISFELIGLIDDSSLDNIYSVPIAYLKSLTDENWYYFDNKNNKIVLSSETLLLNLSKPLVLFYQLKESYIPKKEADIIKRQFELRNYSKDFNTIAPTLPKIVTEKNLKKTIEDMSILGNIIKEQIIEEKKTNPEKFISIEEAIHHKDTNNEVFVLGLLSQQLENYGVTTAIERNQASTLIEKNIVDTSLQFLINGLGMESKYTLHFDLGNERNEELLIDLDKQKKFNDKLRKKISTEFSVNEDDVIITYPQKGSYKVLVIFKSKDFNELSKEQFMEKFKNEPELCNLKEFQRDTIINGCKLNLSMLDNRGNQKKEGYGINEQRGGEKYYPPLEWTRYGLRVLGKYDNGNDDWLGCRGVGGEWCVAYHGVGRYQESNQIKKIVGIIAQSNLKPGSGQMYRNYEDQRHPGLKVGEGVYCSPKPDVLDNYAGEIEVGNDKYKIGFMCRVRPDKYRCPKEKNDYWVVNGTPDEIRPYGILVKKI